MSMNELPNTRGGRAFTGRCVLLATHATPEQLRRCRASIRAHTPEDVAIVEVEHDASAINREIARLAPADVVVLTEACVVSAGWLDRLAAAASADTNTASASAFADGGTPLALHDRRESGEDSELPVAATPERSQALRPRISRAVGPCVYLRRDALQLAGPLDETLDLRAAIEVDFAQRCVLDGLGHVAADDVVVARLEDHGGEHPDLAAPMRKRYPYLQDTPLADSGVLSQALLRARGPRPRLPVTFDARALDGAITGTQVHVLELILALARTKALELRVLVRDEQIDAATRRLLGGLANTELLAAERLDPATARSAVFHRPQQTFSPSDVGLALALGERFVISQLDLIAYRNPSYFADATTWEDYRAASRHGLSAAERVVVFSAHTRDELLADALVDAARVRVVPPGLDHRRADAQKRPAALGVDWPDGFLLCLGTDFRHKNRVFALRLLASLRRRHGWSGGLVLAGTHVSPGSSAQDEREYMLEHPDLADFVVSLGTVDERERDWLVASASAIAYPSVYEGFGLVPFESALSGVPCLFAAQSSLAGVAPADTATIVPWDPDASATAAHALLVDAEARDAHVQALATAARELTWDAAAAATVEIYREAALAPVRDSATLSRDLVAREARLSVQHEEEVARLVGERAHAQRMYDALNAEVGFGLSLIGPNGALSEGVQRALLALVARPALSRPLFACLGGVFVGVRAFLRPIRALSRRSR
jgi:glycosyltransferase involved in cell wall biosynthesis